MLGGDNVLKGWLKDGKGSNTREDMEALWGLIFLAKWWGLSFAGSRGFTSYYSLGFGVGKGTVFGVVSLDGKYQVYVE